MGENPSRETPEPLLALAGEAAGLLASKGLTIAVAECSLGGYCSYVLTCVPGISGSFLGGVVAYGNRLKADVLKVPAAVMEHEGAVSAQTALAMAAGVRLLAGADIGLSETGIAGPGGGSALKPVGTVYIAIVCRDGYQLAERCLFTPFPPGQGEEAREARLAFKERTAEAMFDLALHYLRRERPLPAAGDCPPEAF